MSSLLPLIVKPKLNGNFAAGVFRRQGTKSVDSLQGAHGRLVQRRNSARLLDANVAGRTASVDIEDQVNSARVAHSGINFHLVPVIGYGTIHLLYIPAEARAEIGILKAESAVGVGRGKTAVRTADGATLSVWNRGLRRGYWTRPDGRFGDGFFDGRLDDLSGNGYAVFGFNRLGLRN